MKDRISQLLDESASHARARMDQSPPTPMPAALVGAVNRRRRTILVTRVSVVLAAVLCMGSVVVLSLPRTKSSPTPEPNNSTIMSGNQTLTPAPQIQDSAAQTPTHARANPTLSRLTKTIGRQGVDSAMELLTGSTAQGDGSKPYSPRSTLPEYGEGREGF